MRCLNCGKDAIAIKTEICPRCGAYLPSLMRDLLPYGHLLNSKYRIDYPLGRGGFGVTYRGIHTYFEESVAIKEFYPIEQAARDGKTTNLRIPDNKQNVFERGLKRFLREAKIIKKISHPNIVKVTDFFEENNSAYIVMSLISGNPLSSVIKEQSNNCLPASKVREIIEPLVDALDTIHGSSIYHLDIKPDNILIAKDGKLILVDFGASKQGMGNESTQAFTIAYAPLELISGDPVGPYSDIYEVGVIVYQMLTGKLPPNALTRISQQDNWDASDLEQPWRNLVEVAMKMNPKDRPTNIKSWWQSAFELDENQRENQTIEVPPIKSNTPLNNPSSSEPTKDNSEDLIARPVSVTISMPRRRLLKIAGFGSLGLGLAVFANYQLEEPVILENPDTGDVLETPDTGDVTENPDTVESNQANLNSFSFEVVTVNSTGEITNRKSRSAKFYREDLGSGITLDTIAIPGGTFTMGAPSSEENSDDDERPQRQVTVPSFFMGKYQVTQAQWRQVASLPKVDMDLNPNPSNFKGDDLPVETVSWNQATEFCKRLSNKTGQTYRLPTEAEWEYACRAGTNTPFHFGPTITTNLANYNGNYTYGSGPKGIYREKTTPVGSFKVANGFGLYDMHGNVWEWCQDDWHSNYENAPTDGSARRSNLSNIKVIRDGSWLNSPIVCRSADRYFNYRGSRFFNIGFRVMRVVPGTT